MQRLWSLPFKRHDVLRDYVRREVEAILSLSALDVAIETVTGNQTEGAYVEFGVYKGSSFAHAYQRFVASEGVTSASTRRFIGVDSFEGLPESSMPRPKQYFAGAYSASRLEFEDNVRKAGVPQDVLDIVEGVFGEIHSLSLSQPIAVTYIDCDLRESAVDALRLCAPHFQNGSCVVFDDYFRYDGKSGIRSAWEEFIEQQPWEATLLHLHRRIAFILNK